MDATGALHKNPDNLNVQMCVWNRSYRRPPVVEITAGIRPRVLLQVSKARTHFTKASEHLRAVCSCQRRLRDSHAIWSSHANLNNLKVPHRWIDFACQLLLHLACYITCNITCLHLIKPTVLSCGHKCSEQSWHFKNPIWASFKSSAFASKGTFRTKTVCLPWDNCWMIWISVSSNKICDFTTRCQRPKAPPSFKKPPIQVNYVTCSKWIQTQNYNIRRKTVCFSISNLVPLLFEIGRRGPFSTSKPGFLCWPACSVTDEKAIVKTVRLIESLFLLKTGWWKSNLQTFIGTLRSHKWHIVTWRFQQPTFGICHSLFNIDDGQKACGIEPRELQKVSTEERILQYKGLDKHDLLFKWCKYRPWFLLLLLQWPLSLILLHLNLHPPPRLHLRHHHHHPPRKGTQDGVHGLSCMNIRQKIRPQDQNKAGAESCSQFFHCFSWRVRYGSRFLGPS